MCALSSFPIKQVQNVHRNAALITDRPTELKNSKGDIKIERTFIYKAYLSNEF